MSTHMPVKLHWFRVQTFWDICISNGVIFWDTLYKGPSQGGCW